MTTIILTNESDVNSISLTLEDKNLNYLTWDDRTETWDEATGTWDQPGTPMTKETKPNSISLTLEVK